MAAAAMSVSKQEDGFQPTLGDDTGLDPSIKDLEVETGSCSDVGFEARGWLPADPW